jgi:phage virion morphogenesis protein
MAGAGIEVKIDGEYQKIIEALQKASSPALQQIAHAGGQALKQVSREAFQKQADPATGEKWKERGDGSITRKLLVQRGTLQSSISMNAFPDGSAIIGSNLVYSRIHHPGSEIPARPYLGVPKDFERQFFDDPAIKELLGMAGGG